MAKESSLPAPRSYLSVEGPAPRLVLHSSDLAESRSDGGSYPNVVGTESLIKAGSP